MMDARSIALALGGDVTGRNSCNVPGPGHSKTDRSLAIKLVSGAPEGFTVFDHSPGANHLGCRDYVRERLGFGQWERGQGRRPEFKAANDTRPDPKKEKLKSIALRIWRESVDPIGTIVERYLHEHRGLELSSDLAGSVIRFNRSLFFDDFNRRPGMVCLYRDIVTNEPCGIHRTFLDWDTAQKIDRKMLGVAMGAAIKLDRHEDVKGTLTIGEGVETVLAARMMGLGPVWALGSSGAVGSFPVLKSLSTISVLQENDLRSRQDVETCARRYLLARKTVTIITPDVGKDMNDSWRASR